MEWRKDQFLISDEQERIDFEFVFGQLKQTYWAADRSRETIAEAIRNSFCLGLYDQERQRGFCRAVSDYATFTWICDVIIDPEFRGRGLGKWLAETLLHHPKLQTRSQVLATRDAHTLYTRFGFAPTEYLKRALPERAR